VRQIHVCRRETAPLRRRWDRPPPRIFHLNLDHHPCRPGAVARAVGHIAHDLGSVWARINVRRSSMRKATLGPLTGHYARCVAVIRGQLEAHADDSVPAREHCGPDLPGWSCKFDSRHPLQIIVPESAHFRAAQVFKHSDDTHDQAGQLTSRTRGVACQDQDLCDLDLWRMPLIRRYSWENVQRSRDHAVLVCGINAHRECRRRRRQAGAAQILGPFAGRRS
jgi:hypothetical protein